MLIPATPYPYYLQSGSHSYSLQRRRSEFRAKDNVPESAGDTKTILIIHKVVLEVVLFQLSPVSGQGLVVEEVMGQVVTDVTEDTSTEDCSCHGPVPVEDGMSQLPEWGSKSEEQCGWHDQSKLVHR